MLLNEKAKDEIDLLSLGLGEVLASEPPKRKPKKESGRMNEAAVESAVEEEGGEFVLQSWV